MLPTVREMNGRFLVSLKIEFWDGHTEEFFQNIFIYSSKSKCKAVIHPQRKLGKQIDQAIKS
jgi:hypothetical protein